MRRFRVIPILLVNKSGLYKSKKFQSLQYVGDPINTVKIFNDKEVDEICILDISATAYKKGPNFSLINSVAIEALMPLTYGGGISSLEQVDVIFRNGVEKIVINLNKWLNLAVLNIVHRKVNIKYIILMS
jgi:cyclase